MTTYAEWQIDAVPGARAALAEITELEAALPSLSSASREASLARAALGHPVRVAGTEGREDSTVWEPSPDTDEPTWFALNQACRRAEDALRANATARRRAAAKLHATMEAGRGALVAAAPAIAKDAHSELRAAVATLRRELPRRNQAARMAGLPRRSVNFGMYESASRTLDLVEELVAVFEPDPKAWTLKINGTTA